MERPDMLSGTPSSSWTSLELRKPPAYLGGNDPGTVAVMSKTFLCVLGQRPWRGSGEAPLLDLLPGFPHLLPWSPCRNCRHQRKLC